MKKIACLLMLVIIVSVGPILSGCASEQEHSKTVERTSTSSTGNPNNQTTTTTTTTTDKSSTKEPDSILGATAHAIGPVVLFPFRLIGDAVELIV
jgi:uncharacterized lipoprotein YajG